MKKFCPPATVRGEAAAPASKSSMQRAILCAALATGDAESILRRPSDCADSRAAAALVKSLGAGAEWHPDCLAVRGGILACAAAGQKRQLSCGESGFLMRTFAPIACLCAGETQLLAEGSLARRPVSMLEAPLRALGARCETAQGLPPVNLCGPLRGGSIEVDASTSSQFLTGLLIALPLADSDSVLRVPHLVSQGYIDLTIDTMRGFGVEITRSADFSRFDIKGRQCYHPADFLVEADWSGGAFLLVAAAIAGARGTCGDARDGCAGGALRVEGLDPCSKQPDRAVLDALSLAGAAVEQGGSWIAVAPPRGRTLLKSFDFDATDCPDLFPPLVCLAASAEGTSRIKGARRLKNKESDRAAALAAEFGNMGITVRVDDDTMSVEGSGGHIRGGHIDARGDHRIAMAGAVTALASAEGVEIEGAECVSKSWPSFFEDLEASAFPRC